MQQSPASAPHGAMDRAAASRRRLLVLGIVLALSIIASTLGLTMGAPTSLDPLYPGFGAYQKLLTQFGLDRTVTVILEDQAPLRIEAVKALHAMTNALSDAGDKGVLSARSVTNLPSIIPTGDGEVDTQPLAPEPPADETARAALEARIKAEPNAMGSFISADLSAYMIVLQLSASPDMGAIMSLIDTHRGTLTVGYVGMPFVAHLIQMYPWWILAAIPLALLLLLTIWVLRTPVGRREGLKIAGVTLLLTLLGLAATLCVSPALLPLAPVTGVLAAASAHLLLHGAARELDRGRRAGAAFILLGILLWIAGGYELRWLGVGFAILGALHLPIALLSPVPNGGHQPPTPEGPWPLARLRAALVILTVILALVLTFTGKTSGSPEDLLSAPGSSDGARILDAHFQGGQYVHIRIDSDSPRHPASLALCRWWDRHLAATPQLPLDVRSACGVLEDLNGRMNGEYNLPLSREAINDLAFFIDGNPDFSALGDPDLTRLMVVARCSADAGAALTQRIEAGQARLEELGLDPDALRADLYASAWREAGVEGATLPTPDLDAVLRLPDLADTLPRTVADILADPSMPLTAPEIPENQLRQLLENGAAGFPERFQTLAETFPDYDSLSEDIKPQYAALVTSRLERRLLLRWADMEVASRAADLKTENPVLWRRINGLLLEHAHRLAAPVAAVEAPRTLEYSSHGLPLIGAQVSSEVRRSLIWSLLLVLPVFVFVNLWYNTVAAIMGAAAVALFLGVLGLLGLPITSAGLLCAAAMAASAAYLRALRLNPPLYRSFNGLILVGGVALLVAGVTIPAARDLWLAGGAAMIAIAGWLLTEVVGEK